MPKRQFLRNFFRICVGAWVATKLHIKVGAVELDYEGDDKFTKADMLEVLEAVKQSSSAVGEPAPSGMGGGTPAADSGSAKG